MERASRHGIERASSYQPDAAAYTSSQLYASSTSSSAVDIGSGGRRINRWFNLNLEDIAGIKEEARLWRHAAHGPPPMFISVYLDVSGVQGEELQVTDVFGRAWTVDLDAGACRARAVALESWRLDLAAADACAADLPRVYKQAIVFFRSLYAFAGLLPSTGLARRLADGVLGMYVALHAEPAKGADVIGLDVGLTGTEQFLESHELAPVATPMGTFTMSVQYRRECAFACAPLAGAHEPGDSVQGLDT
ncbi:autophagy protein 13, partial [Coemansia sp. RSA 2618]